MTDVTDAKFVYTLSSRRGLVHDAVQSIRTLLNWVSPEQVVVFYTPPYDDEHRRILTELGIDLREKENKTPAFAMKSGTPASHYGEKCRIGSLESETVVFLDCDTLVLGDPVPVLEGDFDFKARPGTYNVKQTEWQSLFDQYNEEYLDWMPNAGFMVFKNGTHKKIQSDWVRYIGEEIELPSAGIRHGEQYALALAISGYETEKMDLREHVMNWNGETCADGVVYHGDTPSDDSMGSTKENLIRAFKSLAKRNI